MTLDVLQSDLDLTGTGAILEEGRITIRTPVKGIPVTVSVQLSAPGDGSLEINIVRAVAAGLGLFGVVRAKAAAVLMERLAPYGTVWKASDGNVRFAFVSRWQFRAASVTGSVASFELALA